MRDFKRIPLYLVLLLILSCTEEVDLADQEWNYENGICKVTFVLKNRKDVFTSRNVRIAAHKFRSVGDGGTVDQIIGEMTFSIELKPFETLEKTETIDLDPNVRPSMVVVSHFKPK